MRRPKLYVAVLAMAALMAVIPAGSAAGSQFHWSSTGSYESQPLGTQTVLTLTDGPSYYKGSIECSNASGNGTLTGTTGNYFYLTVTYSNCKVFGFVHGKAVDIKYRYHANGEVDILAPATFSVLSGWCTWTIEAQTGLKDVSYSNSGNNMIIGQTLSNVSYSAGGSLCPSGTGTNATAAGESEMKMTGGGSINWEYWP